MEKEYEEMAEEEEIKRGAGRHGEKLVDYLTSREHRLVLDIGCGDDVSIPLLKRESLVVQIDIVNYYECHTKKEKRSCDRKQFEPLLEKYEKYGIENAEFLQADGYSLPFKNGVFDLVYASSSIVPFFHGNFGAVEIDRVLKPGGDVILFSSNGWIWEWRKFFPTIICKPEDGTDEEKTLFEWQRQFSMFGYRTGWINPKLPVFTKPIQKIR
jgi:ubiquinone/menaquinone biosynthesis C-methylase UbiE